VKTQMVKTLFYKPEGRGLESGRGQSLFVFCLSIYLILPAALGLGIYSASNRNEYQKQKNNVLGGVERGRCVGVTAICEPIV
jgi:hypothetical protein